MYITHHIWHIYPGCIGCTYMDIWIYTYKHGTWRMIGLPTGMYTFEEKSILSSTFVMEINTWLLGSFAVRQSMRIVSQTFNITYQTCTSGVNTSGGSHIYRYIHIYIHTIIDPWEDTGPAPADLPLPPHITTSGLYNPLNVLLLVTVTPLTFLDMESVNLNIFGI